MRWFTNLNISIKLTASFILIALISGGIGAYGMYSLKASKTADTVMTMIVVVVIVMTISTLIGSYISGFITKPLKKVLYIIEEMSKGHLGERADINTNDEVGQMAEVLDNFVHNLQNEVISVINNIAKGDINMDITMKGENNVIAPNLNKMIENIRALVNDVNMLSNAAIEGNFNTRADATKHEGDFKKVIDGVNGTFDTVVDKVVWYEAIIDAIPFPIHVTDNDMNWTYMNKSFENLMIKQGVIRDRKSGYGLTCSHAGANICNTENCGIRQLHKGKAESFFDWCGMNNKQDTAYLKNRKGENVGYVEVVTDLTPIIRVSDYTKTEVKRLEGNLKLLSKGNTNFDLNINEGDKYTDEVMKQFEEISNSLRDAKKAVDNLVRDAEMLSNQAIEGKFETRADETKHEGDFKKVIAGVNGTLDTVVDKVVWYEAIIDAIPFPIHVTDNDMNWTYMNKSFENLMINQGVVRDRKSGYGLACSHAGANICNTDKCGIKQLHKGKAESFFEWCGMSNKQDTSYLKNKKGENVGYVEVVTDLTPIIRVSDYTKVEVKRIEENLKLLSNGNTNLDFNINEADKYTGEVKEQFEGINNSLRDVKNAVDNLLKDAIMLSQASIEGKFEIRADVTKHDGDYRKVIEGVNGTLDTVVDKVVWYEAIIDAIPFPIHVTDNDMNWTYMNKSFEKLMIEQGVVRDRKSGYGLACSHAGANICNTEKCGIKQLHKGKAESFFEWCGMSNKQDTSYLKNKKGENVGYVEVVTDLTPIIRVSDYTKTEVKRLEGNLKLLSNGNTNFDLKIQETDKYTGEVSTQFGAISNSLKDVKIAVDNLVTDANMLSNAATDGKLDIRADVAKHNGDFRKIVEGVNQLIGEMVKPIKEVTHVMGEISKGNLEVPVKCDYKGEFGVLASSVNTTEERLKDIVGEISEVIGEISQGNLAIEKVKEFDGNFNSISVSLNTIIESLNSVLSEINNAAEQVLTGAGQVSDGSQALSQGATEQASAIEQLTSSITEVAAQTKENAVNANEAKNLALNVKENAEEGNRHMSEMLKSMGEINESSANISKIIKVIDEIAFQTNILALNAAVEAARAGQHGKGFAVVAEEVRNLAARSANAAKETTDLIEGSIKKAEKGTDIANNTAKALDEIVSGVSKAATLVAEIAAASNEQATGISQINLGIEQVSQVVQNNSATAEESAAASEELSSQSEMLKNMVSSFKLKNSGNKNNLLSGNFKQNKNRQYYNESYQESAVSSKSKISLSDSNFDKY